MAITDKNRQKYILSLYPKETLKQIAESGKRHRLKVQELKKVSENITMLANGYTMKMYAKQLASLAKHYERYTELAIQDHLLLDEQFRLVKKHMNISDKQVHEILKHRMPSKMDEKMLNLFKNK